MVPHSDYPKYMALLQTKPEFSKFTENEMQIFSQDVVFKNIRRAKPYMIKAISATNFIF